jgi:hypothetical protein
VLRTEAYSNDPNSRRDQSTKRGLAKAIRAPAGRAEMYEATAKRLADDLDK